MAESQVSSASNVEVQALVSMPLTPPTIPILLLFPIINPPRPCSAIMRRLTIASAPFLLSLVPDGQFCSKRPFAHTSRSPLPDLPALQNSHGPSSEAHFPTRQPKIVPRSLIPQYDPRTRPCDVSHPLDSALFTSRHCARSDPLHNRTPGRPEARPARPRLPEAPRSPSPERLPSLPDADCRPRLDAQDRYTPHPPSPYTPPCTHLPNIPRPSSHHLRHAATRAPTRPEHRPGRKCAWHEGAGLLRLLTSISDALEWGAGPGAAGPAALGHMVKGMGGGSMQVSTSPFSLSQSPMKGTLWGASLVLIRTPPPPSDFSPAFPFRAGRGSSMQRRPLPPPTPPSRCSWEGEGCHQPAAQSVPWCFGGALGHGVGSCSLRLGGIADLASRGAFPRQS